VGERQQLEITRLLWLGARVLIFDEPTTGISASQRIQLFATLRALAAEGLIVIFVSHKLEEVEELCNSVTVLRQGQVVGGLTVVEPQFDGAKPAFVKLQGVFGTLGWRLVEMDGGGVGLDLVRVRAPKSKERLAANLAYQVPEGDLEKVQTHGRFVLAKELATPRSTESGLGGGVDVAFGVGCVFLCGKGVLVVFDTNGRV